VIKAFSSVGTCATNNPWSATGGKEREEGEREEGEQKGMIKMENSK
jgi:hypothetical protein